MGAESTGSFPGSVSLIPTRAIADITQMNNLNVVLIDDKIACCRKCQGTVTPTGITLDEWPKAFLSRLVVPERRQRPWERYCRLTDGP